jgi:hypothetical protein
MNGSIRTVANLISAGRVVVGVGFCVAPQLGSRWVGRDGKRRGTQVLARALGVRDAALGLAVIGAKGSDELRRLLVLSALSDAVDFAATSTLPPSSERDSVLVIAAAAGVTGLALAAAVRS